MIISSKLTARDGWDIGLDIALVLRNALLIGDVHQFVFHCPIPLNP